MRDDLRAQEVGEYQKGTPRFVHKDITMSELSRRVDLHISTISRYFSGERIPNFLIGLEISNALGVDPWKLADIFEAFKRG